MSRLEQWIVKVEPEEDQTKGVKRDHAVRWFTFVSPVTTNKYDVEKQTLGKRSRRIE